MLKWSIFSCHISELTKRPPPPPLPSSPSPAIKMIQKREKAWIDLRCDAMIKACLKSEKDKYILFSLDRHLHIQKYMLLFCSAMPTNLGPILNVNYQIFV